MANQHENGHADQPVQQARPGLGEIVDQDLAAAVRRAGMRAGSAALFHRADRHTGPEPGGTIPGDGGAIPRLSFPSRDHENHEARHTDCRNSLHKTGWGKCRNRSHA